MSTQHEPPFNTPAYQNYLEIMKKTEPESIGEAPQLCKDLEVLCTQDSTILEEVIDEYVYLLAQRRLKNNDNRFYELQDFVKKELEGDDA